MPDTPVLELPGEWQDDSGKNFKLAELRGRPVLISMFYASCEGVCVVTRNDMKAVEASLPPDVRERTTFVLVTLAPERDGPAQLKQYRADFGLPKSRWRLLRGSAEDTAALAARLGIGFGRDTAGLFRHSSELTVLDAAGNIVLQQDGIHADLSATVKAVADAAKTPPFARTSEIFSTPASSAAKNWRCCGAANRCARMQAIILT